MANWIDLPLDRPLYANIDPDAVVQNVTAMENAFITHQGTLKRFPGLVRRVDFGDLSRVYLHDFEGDLIAGTDKGRVYRIDRGYNVTDVTGLSVSGGRRPIFAKTDRELLIAAGGPIVRLRDRTTELLSTAAPLATHIAWIDNFTVAVERDSGRFFHSGAGTPDQWDPLDTFSADGSPDNINSMIVTGFRELLLGGEDSIEQFERLPTGDVPFFRRWAIADGVKVPYGIISTDNALFFVNSLNEFVRMAGRSTQSVGDDIGRLLEQIDNWDDFWLGGFPASPLNIAGEKFLLMQAPNATNAYGTKGVTLVYDYRARRFFSLYGWSEGVPRRYGIWSHWRLWDRVFCGGEGAIYELTESTHVNGTEPQRFLVRTAHIASGHGAHIKNFRLQVRRGVGSNTVESKVRVRCSRDAKPFGNWVERSLGKAGDTSQMKEFGGFGMGGTFQFEIACTDDAPLDLIKAQVDAAPLR